MKSTVDEWGKKPKAKAGSLNRQHLLKLEKKRKNPPWENNRYDYSFAAFYLRWYCRV